MYGGRAGGRAYGKAHASYNWWAPTGTSFIQTISGALRLGWRKFRAGVWGR